LVSRISFFQKNSVRIIFVMSAYMFLSTIVPFIGYSRATKGQLAFRPDELPGNIVTNSKPDVYYLVLDRYTNDRVLQTQLGYDNTPFTQGLVERGFYVKNDAYAAYPYTSSSIGSTMSLDFLNQLQDKFGDQNQQTQTALFRLTQYSTFAKELRDGGYDYSVLGSWYGVSNDAPYSNDFRYELSRLRFMEKGGYLAEFESNYVATTALAAFATGGLKSPLLKTPLLRYSVQDHAGLANFQLAELEKIANSEKQGGRFIFAHILLPHDPYVFNEDGSLSTVSQLTDNIGRLATDKYLQQLKYVNTRLKKLVDEIQAKSSNKAVIVLQADEGFYPHFLTPDGNGTDMNAGDMRTWSNEYLRAKYGVLAAYHLPGVPESELKHITNTNIFRVILNNYFGYDLPYLPDCHFAYPEGRAKAFVFTDITPRLEENPDPRCATVHDKAVSQPTHY
jgi:Sulfatase